MNSLGSFTNPAAFFAVRLSAPVGTVDSVIGAFGPSQ
jgi:hypothetical protein